MGVIMFSIVGVLALSTSTSLSAVGNGIAELSIENTCGNTKSAHISAGSINGPINEGRIRIVFTDSITLGDIDNIDWEQYVTAGYPSHADILLDIDGDGAFDSKKDLESGDITSGNDDVLVAEFAYNPLSHASRGVPYTESGDLNTCISTFNENTEINNGTKLWLYSACPGALNDPDYPDFLDYSLEEWKNGQTRDYVGCGWGTPPGSLNGDLITIDSDTKVYGFEIEVDGWIAGSEAYVSNVRVNGEVVEDFEGTQTGTGGIVPDMTFIPNPNPLDFGLIVPGRSSTVMSILSVGSSNLQVTDINVAPGFGTVFNETNVLFSTDGITFVDVSSIGVINISALSSEDLYTQLTIPVGTSSGSFSGTISYTVMEQF